MSELVIAKKARMNMISGVLDEQTHTLARQGLDPKVFNNVVLEAMLANANILEANQTQLVVAMRKVCQDGLVPNGREAALIVSGNGNVSYLPMRDGMCKIIHRLLGAEIRAGHVRANSSSTVKITERTDADDAVEIVSSFDDEDDGSGTVNGAWVWIKVPGHFAFVHRFTKRDIDAAREASNKKTSGPWENWTGFMAEKAVVKSGCRRALYMFPDLAQDKVETLQRVLDEDDAREVGPVIVEGEGEEILAVDAPIVVNPVKPETAAPTSRKQTKTTDAPKATGRKATAKKAEPTVEPEPEQEQGQGFLPNDPLENIENEKTDTVQTHASTEYDLSDLEDFA